MDGRSETPQTQQLTNCENTRNEKRVSMDGRSETPQIGRASCRERV